ncbi:chemotaxis protein histidine kinase-like protein [Burkholderiales bacterium JOSHI_001]|nr:chemotaxis protein histidine kinase-like protein [Burkholderiales bacterium JOSHI_001]
MAANRDIDASGDLSTLAWVSDELRRSLETAHKALRRHLKEAESHAGSDTDVVDPAILRQARNLVHQGAGALELVGLSTASQMLRAAEAAITRMGAKPKLMTPAAVAAIERASFALLDYLGRMLAGKAVTPLAMFPQYRALQELAGAARVHPADLWPLDWQWRELPASAGLDPAAPLPANEATGALVEAEMLALMRGLAPQATTRMSALCAGLAAGSAGRLRTFWALAGAFYEAQSDGLLKPDLYGKRVASRLLAQVRAGAQADPPDRLAQDLMFFCAHASAKPAQAAGPLLRAVRDAYQVAPQAPVDYESSPLGRFDPAVLAQARKRVAGAKDVWSGVAGGDLHRLPNLNEQFALVGESLTKLYPQGELLGHALTNAAAQTVAGNGAPPAELAMEVATGLLYLDASLEDGELDHPELSGRIQRLAQRVDSVRQGRSAGPLEPWQEELYRRVSDRQTMGSVVQELRASLSDVEKQIDQYFRNPAQREVLIPVPGQLSSMRGVLSVLGMDAASQAVVRMRDDVDALAQTEVDPQRAQAAGTFERLADNLGALSFLIDMLSVQPQMAKSLFSFDAATGNLNAVMGRTHRHSTFGTLEATTIEPQLAEKVQAVAAHAAQPATDRITLTMELDSLAREATVANQPVLATRAAQASAAIAKADDTISLEKAFNDTAHSMADFLASVSGGLDGAPSAPAPLPPAPAPAVVASGLEDDAEMRDIFLEEAREVVQTARDALAQLARQPDDSGEATTVRRAFHTLKGSSRMVGLADFGEAAWSCEQLYNARLADNAPADGDLLGFSGEAVDYFARWVDAIAAGNVAGFAPQHVSVPADALRQERRRLPVGPLAEPAASVAAEAAKDTAPERTLVLPHPAPAAPEPPDAAPASALGELALRIPDLPSAADLDLSLPGPDAAPPPALQPQLTQTTLAPVDFAIDLTALDAEPVAPMIQPLAPAGRPSETPDDAVDLLLDGETAEPSQAAAPDLDLSLPELPAALPDLATAQPEEAPAPAVAALASAPTDWPEPVPEPHVTLLDATDLAEAGPEADLAQAAAEEEQVKVIGPLRISIPLFNIYLNEADEQSRRLATEVAEWGHELQRPVGETAVALAHSLAGNSATVGFADLSQLARFFEHALMRSHEHGSGTPDEAQLFNDAAEEIRRLLHQFAAGFLRDADPLLLQRLSDHEHLHAALALQAAPDELPTRLDALPEDLAAPTPSPLPLPVAEVAEPAPVEPEPEALAPAEAAAQPEAEEPNTAFATQLGGLAMAEFSELGQTQLHSLADLPAVAGGGTLARADALDDADDIDVEDALDADLFPIFEEEALELLPQLQQRMRDWARRPGDAGAASACMRTLHTLKGGARLAGAMRLGEMAHRLETAIEHTLARGALDDTAVAPLLGRVDAIDAAFDALRRGEPLVSAPAPLDALPSTPAALHVVDESLPMPLADEAPAVAPVAETPAAPHTAGSIDWASLSLSAVAPQAEAARSASASQAAVRVRAPLLDRLVSHAGEVSITRARIDSDVGQMKGALGDLTENLERLRRHLRDIELQAETQISTRIEAAKAASQAFDPLEMDRFTRFQELTRMMAESVNDVATVQRGLQRTLQSAEDELAAQARLTRDLQDDLLRTRMVEFEGQSERLYRVVRQAAKETGKQVRLDIVGGAIEMDRGVLDRMTGAFEHLLRNCVTHGIESPEARSAAGKDPVGSITIVLSQEGNEVGVEFRDDGAGLDMARIQAKAVAQGLLPANAQPGEAELANLIFTPGFTTAETITELSGRGVGMDVVRSEVNAMGGRIITATAAGKGTSFRLVLPLTTAVTQVVMVRVGEVTVALPSTLVELVRRTPAAELEQAYRSNALVHDGQPLPFFWLGALLHNSPRGHASGRNSNVLIMRSAAQRIALHVDEVVANQEVVVKNLGPQLARLPGLAGMTLLPSGAPALIYNPVALATLYGEAAWARTRDALAAPQPTQVQVLKPAAPAAPLVLVVDDSLTVRRVTQRLLTREGYRVELAKDGLEGLERLAEERPAVVLSDIEMPRMDGFDLLRNIRADAQLNSLPVVMITSRIAQKHRDHATELGANHYLGKPYSEEELLALVAQYARAPVSA